MHVIFRESHGLDETATPTDLGQCPADLVVLSFSDSDLGAFAAGWHRAEGSLPGLRLANLAALGHPLSVDTYVERTLSGAKGILIRLIGGVPYWSYGLAQVEALARDGETDTLEDLVGFFFVRRDRHRNVARLRRHRRLDALLEPAVAKLHEGLIV
jgi:cobalamin biosynthesis Mg chelatase CobN